MPEEDSPIWRCLPLHASQQSCVHRIARSTRIPSHPGTPGIPTWIAHACNSSVYICVPAHAFPLHSWNFNQPIKSNHFARWGVGCGRRMSFSLFGNYDRGKCYILSGHTNNNLYRSLTEINVRSVLSSCWGWIDPFVHVHSVSSVWNASVLVEDCSQSRPRDDWGQDTWSLSGLFPKRDCSSWKGLRNQD